MSRWDDRLAAHPIHENLHDLEEDLGIVRDQRELDAEAIEALARVDEIIAVTRRALDAVDASLLTTARLDQVASQISALTQTVGGWGSDGSPSHFDSMAAQGDAILDT